VEIMPPVVNEVSALGTTMLGEIYASKYRSEILMNVCSS